MNDPLSIDPVSLRWHLPTVLYGDAAPAAGDLAEEYHEASKLSPATATAPLGAALLAASPTLQSLVESPVRRREHLPEHQLPPPVTMQVPFGKALSARRSRRDFSSKPLPLSLLATLLYAAGGQGCDTWGRTVPSGGGLYPLEAYVAVERVDALPPGVYHYDPRDHAVEQLSSTTVSDRLGDALVHSPLAAAPAVVILTALFWRSRFKYGLRGYRFCLLEAGHAAQNVLLAAAALDLASVPVAGFFDARLERLLRVDGVEEAPLYCLPVGYSTDTATP